MIKLFLSTLLIKIFLISSLFAEIIKNVDIRGNIRISDETILVLGDIDIGTNYKTDDLNNIVKKLYESEFFEDISLNLINNILTINLIENPIIENI